MAGEEWDIILYVPIIKIDLPTPINIEPKKFFF